MYDIIAKIIVLAGIALAGLRGILPDATYLCSLRSIATALIVSLISFGVAAAFALYRSEPKTPIDESLEQEAG